MNDFEKLKDALATKIFIEEPLAEAIIWYLKKHDPDAYNEINNTLEKIVERNIRNLLNNYEADIS